MNNTLEATQSRITKAEKWKINDLEDRMVEITATEHRKKIYIYLNEDSLTDLWDNIKCTNIPIRGGPRRRRKGPEKIFEEIITENFHNMGKEVVNLIQDAKRVPSSINPRRNTQDTQ